MMNTCIQFEPLAKLSITAGGIKEKLLQELRILMSKTVDKLRGAHRRKGPLRAG